MLFYNLPCLVSLTLPITNKALCKTRDLIANKFGEGR